MKVNLLGNTSQTGTPTPDSPIPVNVVSGDNTINVTGKNLANINVIDSLDVPAFKRIVANDTITIWDNTNTSGFMTTERKLSQICPSLKVGDTVTLTYTTTWNSNYIYLVGWNNVWINGNTKTITQEMLDSTVIMYGGYNATTVISNFMFRYSSITDTTYEPYTSTSYPIHLGEYELCKIGDYQDRFIRNSGKNLYSAGNQTCTRVSNRISIEPIEAGTYNFSCNCTSTDTDANTSAVLFYGDNNNLVGSRAVTRGDYSSPYLTLSATAYYVEFYASDTWTHGEGDTATFSNIMISKENIPYEPYGTNEWYLEKKIGKVVLDGSETDWVENIAVVVTNAYLCNESFTNRLARGVVLCNYLSVLSSAEGTGIFSGGSINFCFASSDFDTLEKLKTWLSTHNLIVYYQYATPTYTPITGTLKDELEAVWRANSYNGTTNINQINNDLPFNLDVEIKVGS